MFDTVHYGFFQILIEQLLPRGRSTNLREDSLAAVTHLGAPEDAE